LAEGDDIITQLHEPIRGAGRQMQQHDDVAADPWRRIARWGMAGDGGADQNMDRRRSTVEDVREGTVRSAS
jgi:hypothetical protein